MLMWRPSVVAPFRAIMQPEHSISFFGEAQSIPKQFNFLLKINSPDPERFISKKENKKRDVSNRKHPFSV
jgi:hypothetical protein